MKPQAWAHLVGVYECGGVEVQLVEDDSPKLSQCDKIFLGFPTLQDNPKWFRVSNQRPEIFRDICQHWWMWEPRGWLPSVISQGMHMPFTSYFDVHRGGNLVLTNPYISRSCWCNRFCLWFCPLSFAGLVNICLAFHLRIFLWLKSHCWTRTPNPLWIILNPFGSVIQHPIFVASPWGFPWSYP